MNVNQYRYRYERNKAVMAKKSLAKNYHIINHDSFLL